YSLYSLLKTDFMRAVSMTRLKLRHRGELGQNNTSIPTSYMASVPLCGVGVLGLLLGLVLGLPGATAVGAVATLGCIGLNWEFLQAIRHSDGWARCVGAMPLLWLELLVVGIGTAIGLASFPFGRRY